MDWIRGRQGGSLDFDNRRNDSYLGPTSFMSEGGCVVGSPEPQAFLAKCGAGSGTLRTHFHPVDQYQYFVQGSGRFAGHDIGPGVVHYADRFQPYGPLELGLEGLAFLTLRTVTDCGAFYMPEERDELGDRLRDSERPASERLNISFDLRSLEFELGWNSLHERADGMSIRVGRAEPGASLEPVDVGGSGAYLVVVEGSVARGTGEWGESSIAWLEPATTSEQITGGKSGVVVAVLQVPERAVRAVG